MSSIPFAALKAAVPLPALIGQDIVLKRAGRVLVGLCPFHGERTPSFTVYPDHFHCFGCGAHGDAVDWLTQVHGLSLREAIKRLGGDAIEGRPVTPLRAPAAREAGGGYCQHRAAQIWNQAIPAEATPVEAYLHGRGLALPDDAPLRYHPCCDRGDDRMPAMIALMTDPATGEPTGIHRTFLEIHGASARKADVDSPKMMLGRAGVIRLVPDLEIGIGLGLAEGIETALAVSQLIGWGPCWAAGSRVLIARFPVLSGFATITVFADGDAPGRDAAGKCADHWADAGREAHIWTPPTGQDWLDAAVPSWRAA